MPPENGSTPGGPPSAVMVGRAVEMRSAMIALTATRGSVLLISGEAGIGKTTLIDAALRRIDRPYLIARAPDDDGTSPYWPWKRLARTLPGVRQALAAAADGTDVVRSEDTAAARFRLHDRVADALAEAAGTDGLVLVLEDAHLADPASLGLLGHLAGTLDAEPLVLVVTFREPGGAAPVWQQVLPRMLRSPALTRISLTGFTPAECAEYVTAATGRNPDAAVLGELMHRTARNPLYLKTMVDLLIRNGRSVRPGAHGAGVQKVATDAMGSDLTSLVAALVDDLPESTRSLLALASVLEHDISVDRLATVSSRPPIEVSASCDAARAAGVVLDDGDGLRFSHAVVRDGIYAGIPATERTRWHRAVAGRLARQLPPGEVAAHLAGARRTRDRFVRRQSGPGGPDEKQLLPPPLRWPPPDMPTAWTGSPGPERTTSTRPRR